MVTFYTKEDYSKAYTELLEILKHIPAHTFEKIPKENIHMYEDNKDINYEYHYNTDICFEEQNISHLTRILLANLFIDYWATDEERRIIQKHDKNELEQLELEKNKQYNPDDIFASRKKKIEQKAQSVENTSMIVLKDSNFFTKLFIKIKNFLHLT